MPTAVLRNSAFALLLLVFFFFRARAQHTHAAPSASFSVRASSLRGAVTVPLPAEEIDRAAHSLVPDCQTRDGDVRAHRQTATTAQQRNRARAALPPPSAARRRRRSASGTDEKLVLYSSLLV